MLKTFSLLIAVVFTIAPARAAPGAASQLEIIDVLPSVDEDQSIARPSGFISCDF